MDQGNRWLQIIAAGLLVAIGNAGSLVVPKLQFGYPTQRLSFTHISGLGDHSFGEGHVKLSTDRCGPLLGRLSKCALW